MVRPIKHQTDVFDALANPWRRAMIERLKQGELPATALLEAVKLSQPALSRHLKVLREAGVIRQRLRGRQRLYRLNPTALRQAQRWLEGVI